jgi:16S rRNA (guanine966-N2)-methyltransferase
VALEAFSRGYGPVTCVEKDPGALGCLRANLRGTSVGLLAQDVRRLGPDRFRDLAVIFADPPYGESLEAWKALGPALAGWLAPAGVLVWEAPHPLELPEQPGLERLEGRRYGAAVFHFFRRSPG